MACRMALGLLLHVVIEGTALGQPIDTLTQWLGAADFDNYDQLEIRALSHRPASQQKLHQLFSRVELPAFGKNVLYVQSCVNGDPSNITHQSLYVSHSLPGMDGIQTELWEFTNPERFVDAQKYPQKLAGLTPESPEVRASKCALYWHWDAATQQFNATLSNTGAVTDGCSVNHQDLPVQGNHSYLIVDHSVLNATHFEVHPQWFLFDHESVGRRVRGHALPDTLTRSAPIRKFNGWVSVKNPNEPEGYSTMLNVTLFDSGTSFRVVDSNQTSLPWRVELAQCSYGDHPPPILKLAFYKDGESTLPGNASFYTWASSGAKEVGINLRDIQGAFTFKEASL